MAKRPDDDLIVFLYGDHEGPEGHDEPEPRPGLESRMWARVAPSLRQPPRRFAVPAGWLGWAALATGVLVVALLGFLAGRVLRPAPTERAVVENLKALPPEARDRILQAALADHLDASQRLLLEVANGAPSAEEERVWAETLLNANRLYRRAAERAGQRRVAAVLAELEPFLTQLADAPASFDHRRAQDRIENADLLFKLRITRNNLKELS